MSGKSQAEAVGPEGSGFPHDTPSENISYFVKTMLHDKTRSSKDEYSTRHQQST